MNYLELFKESIKERESITDRNSKILLIDGLNTFIRVWSAVPIILDGNRHIGTTQGFLKTIGYLLKQDSYSRCIIVFDGHGGSLRRRKIYPDYKNNRRPKAHRQEFTSKEEEQESFSNQLNRTKEYLNLLPVTVIEEDHIEADDSIAHIIKILPDTSWITIVSTDRDFLQLVNERIHVYSPVKKKTYDMAAIKAEFGFVHGNYLLYRILTGDQSDNIPGVKGLGLKTLLNEYPLDTMEMDLLSFLAMTEGKSMFDKPKKIIMRILESYDQLQLNEKLMQLNDVDISLTTKNRIRDQIEIDTNKLNQYEFLKMYHEDKLQNDIKNIDGWLLNFNQLNIWSNMK